VQVSYPNASARTVEDAVVSPLRNALLQVNKLTDLRSRAREEAAVLYLDFPFGTNPDLAFIEVNEKIDQAMSGLPRDVERPRVLATDVSDIPVVQLSVTIPPRPSQRGGEGVFQEGDSDQRNADLEQRKGTTATPPPWGGWGGTTMLPLSDLARNVLRRRLEQLPEVAFADLSGQQTPRLVVRPDQGALRSLGLTENDLSALLREANIELGGLLLADGHYQYNVRFTGDLRTADDLRGLFLRVGERTVALGELATVTYEAQPPRGAYSYDGRPGIVFTVRKRADARLFALRDNLQTLVADLRTEYPDLRFDLANDQTAVLRASIDNLSSGLLYGAGFAILILFAFFREWRRPLLIGLAVPIALLIAVLGFYLAGLSVNVISLAGLILGLGLMIDNSIIVLDNIASRPVDEHDLGADAGTTEGAKGPGVPAPTPVKTRRIGRISAATNEVIRPLISSALTTVAVFVPLVLLSGIAGALFRDQAIAVTLALVASLLVAYFLLPMLSLLVGPSNARQPNQKSPIENREHEVLRSKSRISNTSNTSNVPPLHGSGAGGKVSVTRNSTTKLPNYITTLLPMAIWLLAGYFLLTALPTQGFPNLSRTDFQIAAEWNEALPLSTHRTRVRALNESLRERFGGHTAAFVGERRFLLDEENQAVNAAELQLYLDDPPPVGFADDLLAEWRVAYPAATFTFRPVANLFDRIFLNDEPWLELRLRDAAARETPAWATAQPLLGDLRAAGLTPTPPARADAVALRIDYAQLATSRVDAARLRDRLLTLFSENEVTSLRANDRALPVLIAGADDLSTDRLLRATVTNRDGNEIPLRYLISTERRPDYRVLTADRAGEYLALTFPEGTAPERVTAAAAAYPTFTAQLAGRFLTDRSRISELGGVLLISLLLLYLILAAQFEGLRLPFVVLLVVPVSLVGSLLALWLTGGTLNLLSLIGMVVTGGIVVNDAIIKVDMIERGRAAGLSVDEAIREASRRRLRAIVMTSLTTMLALAPVLFTSGLGAELQQPLAITVIGGLTVGTVGSLYLVPGLYRLLGRGKQLPR